MYRSIVRRINEFALTLLALCLAPAVLFAQESASQSNGPLPPWRDVVDALQHTDVLNISLWRILLAFLILGTGIAFRRSLLQKALAPLKLLLEKTETEVDDQLFKAIQHPLRWLVNLIAFYFALLVLSLPEPLMEVISLILQTVGTVLVGWLLNKMISIGARHMQNVVEATETSLDDDLLPAMIRVLRLALLALVCMLIIQQWGYDITSLLAGVGLGGLAFALAAKPTLSNWFGSLMIFTDRPFKVGDWVSIPDGAGTVERVGWRSTRLRTFEDTLITVPNAHIADMAIENYSERRKRRIQATLGLIYSTSKEQIRTIVDNIRELLSNHEKIQDEPIIVRFTEFGASALNVKIDCYGVNEDRVSHFELVENLNLEFMAIVREAGSDFAFPSRSLYIESDESDQQPN